eukprot:4164347-Pleurochrysis_carterae.AAC.1
MKCIPQRLDEGAGSPEKSDFSNELFAPPAPFPRPFGESARAEVRYHDARARATPLAAAVACTLACVPGPSGRACR